MGFANQARAGGALMVDAQRQGGLAGMRACFGGVLMSTPLALVGVPVPYSCLAPEGKPQP